MADANTMTNLQLQDDILKNLLLGLQKQSQYYVQKINETGELTEERKNFEKELSDINKVLTELSNKALSYTVQELDNLRTQFNDKLTQLNGVISDLEINTLKIEFDSLTPQQKEFLKGQKGDKGEKGDNLYQFAKMFGFLGTELEFLESLKGQNGKDGLNGQNGTNGLDGQNGADGQNGTNGLDGQNGKDGKDFTFDMFTPAQLQLIASLVTVDLTSIQDKIKSLETAIASLGGSVTPPVVTPPVAPTYFYSKPFVPSTDYFFNSEDYVYSLSFAHYSDELVENWGNDETPDFHSIVRQYFTYFQAFGITSFIRVQTEITISDGLSQNPSKKIVFVNNSRILTSNDYEIVNDSSEIFSENNGSTNTLPEVNIFTLALDSTPSKEVMVEFHKDSNNVLEPFAVDFLGTDKLFYHAQITISSTVAPLDVSALGGSGAYATSFYVPSESPL